MADPAVRPVRCAIYTRKSTEEGLEQAFNSLDAQKEACAAYILSQRHEGWSLAPGDYDDGGFSGGTMDRPALRRLLADIAARRVDIIVVYKIDRLTRSLGDFSRIVDILDGAGASFVSVTQAFNTTTSMGRLTLNVLLSFAQFEREVTGERIRDKIAQSKAKGMWMGGVVPLGYDVVERKLIVNQDEAETVRLIYSRYLALGSVLALQAELEHQGIRGKARIERNGKLQVSAPMSRGALYLLLQNRIYRGEICHKGKAFPGEHFPIVDADLFEAVQRQLERNRVDRRHSADAAHPSLLSGIIWDGQRRRMSPSHASKQARRYRYYISRDDGTSTPIWRVPAGDLEELVIGRLRSFLLDPGAVHDAVVTFNPDAVAIDGTLFTTRRLAQEIELATPSEQRRILTSLLQRIVVQGEFVQLHIDPGALRRLGGGEPADKSNAAKQSDPVVIAVAAKLARIGKEVRLVIAPSKGSSPARRDPALIKLIVKAQAARTAIEQNPEASVAQLARSQGHGREYYGVLLRLSYLAPDIMAAILDGRQPPDLTRQKLARLAGLPHGWDEQRKILGSAVNCAESVP